MSLMGEFLHQLASTTSSSSSSLSPSVRACFRSTFSLVKARCSERISISLSNGIDLNSYPNNNKSIYKFLLVNLGFHECNSSMTFSFFRLFLFFTFALSFSKKCRINFAQWFAFRGKQTLCTFLQRSTTFQSQSHQSWFQTIQTQWS